MGWCPLGAGGAGLWAESSCPVPSPSPSCPRLLQWPCSPFPIPLMGLGERRFWPLSEGLSYTWKEMGATVLVLGLGQSRS